MTVGDADQNPAARQLEAPSTSPPRMTQTNDRPKLENHEVRAIYECLYHEKEPPPHLAFTIIPPEEHGEKLSPPPHEYPHGIYILLRPLNKIKKKGKGLRTSLPTAPQHLQHLMQLEPYSSEYCKWQLSGPQFPKPTAIQQRYCYPQGHSEYSYCNGGSLWTMFDIHGIENEEYRVLHVYFSSKRAANRGRNKRSPTAKKSTAAPTKKGKAARPRTPRRCATHNQIQLLKQATCPPASPAVSFSHASETSSSFNSPLSFRDFYPAGEDASNSKGFQANVPEQLVVSPISDLPNNFPLYHSPFATPGNTHLTAFQQSSPTKPQPSPFRLTFSKPASMINVDKSPLQRTGSYVIPFPQDSQSVSSADDNFPGDLMELPLKNEIDSFWDDPLLTIMTKPSTLSHGTLEADFSFGSRLECLQEGLRKRILSAPPDEQPEYVSALSLWAHRLASDPLAEVQREGQSKCNDANSEGTPDQWIVDV